MASTRLRKKEGVVILLDALGASAYPEEKIKKFLTARSEINSIVTAIAKNYPVNFLLYDPSIYTFGDTIVITVQFRGKKNYSDQIFRACMLMRRYLFHALEQGILFRGAFSIGSYIEDSSSNTVMGEAVTDAAQWYEQADWMGVASTPKTNNAMEYYFGSDFVFSPSFIQKYPVPIKGGINLSLYSISWPGAFHDKTFLKRSKQPNARAWFLKIFKDFSFPTNATAKYENTKQYFSYIESEIAKKMLNAAEAAQQ